MTIDYSVTGQITYSDQLISPNLKKSSFTATSDPTVNTDSSQGYEVGSYILNVSTGSEWRCKDATVGAAVWSQYGSGSGSGTLQDAYDNGNSITMSAGRDFSVSGSADITLDGDAIGIGTNATFTGNLVAGHLTRSTTMRGSSILLEANTSGTAELRATSTNFIRFSDADSSGRINADGLIEVSAGTSLTLYGPSYITVGSTSGDVLVESTTGDLLLKSNSMSSSIAFADTSNTTLTTTNKTVVGSINELDALTVVASNTDVDTGTEVVDSFDPGENGGCVWHVYISDGTNARTSTVQSTWIYSTNNVVMAPEFSTSDIGDTSGVTLSVSMAASTVSLSATVTSDNWNIRVRRLAI